MADAKRPHADWPAAFPPLAIAVKTVQGRTVSCHVSYETGDGAPVLVLGTGMLTLAFSPADMRRMAQLATDHQRAHAQAPVAPPELPSGSVPEGEGDP